MQNLEQRIFAAKNFLNNEVTNLKVSGDANFSLHEIGHHLDTIHEIERIGIRNLDDISSIKLERVLNTVESCIYSQVHQN
jgi:hypothetical protein